MSTTLPTPRPLTAVLLFLFIALPGCAADPSLRGNTAVIPAAEYRATFDAAIIALRAQYYQVDRQDYRYGVVTTRPQSSPTFVEVWDPANSTAYQAFESTFNDQRRFVRVTLEPAGSDDSPPLREGQGESETAPSQPAVLPTAAGHYELRVEAVIERYQNPLRHLTGSTNGHRIIASLSAIPDDLRQRGIPSPYWQPVGRDPYLEQRLLNAIVAGAGVRMDAAPPEPAPPAAGPQS